MDTNIAHIQITYGSGTYLASLYDSLPMWGAKAIDHATGDTPTQAVQALMEKGHLQ